MKQFWDKNKVFILGGLSAVLLAIQPFAQNTSDELKWKTVGFAALMAALSYVAKYWRGQTASILGIIGNLAAAFVTVQETGIFSWNQFIFQGLLAIGFAYLSDPKSRGYEQSAVIKQAKIEGEISNPAPLTNSAVKKEAKNQQ